MIEGILCINLTIPDLSREHTRARGCSLRQWPYLLPSLFTTMLTHRRHDSCHRNMTDLDEKVSDLGL